MVALLRIYRMFFIERLPRSLDPFCVIASNPYTLVINENGVQKAVPIYKESHVPPMQNFPFTDEVQYSKNNQNTYDA